MRQRIETQVEAEGGSGYIQPRFKGFELGGVNLSRWSALLVLRGVNTAFLVDPPTCKVEFLDASGVVRESQLFHGEMRDTGDVLLPPSSYSAAHYAGPAWSSYVSEEMRDTVLLLPVWPQLANPDQIMIQRRIPELATGTVVARCIYTLGWQRIPIQGCHTVRWSWSHADPIGNGAIPMAAGTWMDLLQGLFVE